MADPRALFEGLVVVGERHACAQHGKLDSELLEQYNLDEQDVERLADEQLEHLKSYAENPAV